MGRSIGGSIGRTALIETWYQVGLAGVALRIVVVGFGVERGGIGMAGPDHLRDPRDARRLGAGVVEEHAVAEFHLVAEEVPRLVVPHAVPAGRLIGLGEQVREGESRSAPT